LHNNRSLIRFENKGIREMKMRKSTLLRGLKKIRSNEDEKINATKGA
jgi:hypothetical protein